MFPIIYRISILLFQMSNFEQLPQDIRKQLTDFQSKINTVKSLMGTPKQQAIVKHQKQAKRIRRLMQTYQYSIQSGSFETGVASHKSQYKQFQLQLAKLQKNLQSCKNDVGVEDDLFKHRTNKSSKAIDSNNRQVVIEMGNNAQKEGEDALVRIKKNVVQMDQQADTMMIQLDRQIKQLDKVYEELNDTETTLKRAEKHLKYFAKQIYTDRLMICLIIFIAIAIIVIIALAIAGKTPKALNGAK